MNPISIGYSDPNVYAGNKNGCNIRMDFSKEKKVVRRSSWAGEKASTKLSLSNQSIWRKRPGTSSSVTRCTSKTSSSLSQSKQNMVFLHSFPNRYQQLCEYYSLLPLAPVKAHLPRRTLDFLADRVKPADWKPLLEALSSDQELHMIAIRSRHPAKNVIESIGTEEKACRVLKCPVILTRYCLTRLTASLAECLSNSNSLTCLELEGIPLPSKYLCYLIEGLHKSKTLQHLSFARCSLGDEGIEIVCRALRVTPKVITLNVTACDLTPIGIHHIFSLIKIQKMHRFMETWQQSLRYRNPNLDAMWGLRRITLNCNPLIGDEGIKIISEILEDDLWVKAVDMQKCGIGENGANCLIHLLNANLAIAIVDVRENKNVPSNLLKQIMSLLLTNNAQRKSEYHWISSASSSRSSSKQRGLLERNWEIHRKFANRHISSSNLASQSKISTINKNARPQSQPINSRIDVVDDIMKPSTSPGGIPWRVSLRMKQKRDHPLGVTAGMMNNDLYKDSDSSSRESIPTNLSKNYPTLLHGSRKMDYVTKSNVSHGKNESLSKEKLEKERKAQENIIREMKSNQIHDNKSNKKLPESKVTPGTSIGSGLVAVPCEMLKSMESSIQQFFSYVDFLKESSTENIPQTLQNKMKDDSNISPLKKVHTLQGSGHRHSLQNTLKSDILLNRSDNKTNKQYKDKINSGCQTDESSEKDEKKYRMILTPTIKNSQVQYSMDTDIEYLNGYRSTITPPNSIVSDETIEYFFNNQRRMQKVK